MAEGRSEVSERLSIPIDHHVIAPEEPLLEKTGECQVLWDRAARRCAVKHPRSVATAPVMQLSRSCLTSLVARFRGYALRA